VGEPIEYADILAGQGCAIDIWESTYLHVLPGPDPVLAWFSGTGLRPYLDALRGSGAESEFSADVAAALARVFPPRDYGTVLPFRRIFAIARPDS
jgi:trans-aconitate 2-methyltransferase